ncbi:MAG: helix-turn-helix domain-containing protein [Lysobacter sp.]
MEYALRTSDQLRPVLQGFRKARDLSQTELASRLGITQQALSALEREPDSASVGRLMQVLAALDVEIVLRHKQAAVREPPGSW